MAETSSDNAAASTGTSGTGSSGTGTSAAASTAPASATASLEKAATSLEPGSSAGSAGTSATGTSTGAATSPPAGQQEAPDNRIQRAVANVRKELTDRLGWAERYKPDEVQQATELLQSLNSDPRGFLARLSAELEQDEPDPEADLQSEDGKQKAFSEKAMRLIIKNVEKRLTRQLEERFGPALEFTHEARAQQAVSAKVAEGRQLATQALAQARKLPHFVENEADISTKLASMNPAYRRQVGSVAALYMAYNAVLTEKVLPTLRATSEQEVINGFKKSANASAGQVQPGQGSTGKAALKEGDVDGLARHLETLYGQTQV